LFNNNVEDEADFCEAYKSQILNDDSTEKTSLLATILKIVTILLLLAIIVVISIYSYNYFMNNSSSSVNSNIVSPPVSIQALEEDELGDFKVELVEEPEKEAHTFSIQKKVIEEPKAIEESKVIEKSKIIEKSKAVEETVVVKSVDELDIDKIANDVKLAIAKNEAAELKAAESLKSENSLIKSKSLEVPVADSQSAYLEELAKLSKEIDKERE